MYDRHLLTFLQAADCGSFLKASEKLYISANAVTKQINLLESDLGVRLFDRSTQGLVLTPAGKLIYDEAKKLIRHADQVMQKARTMERRQEFVIHVAVSQMNPVSILLEQWNKAAGKYPNFRLEIVPFEDTLPSFQEIMDGIGTKIDVLACPYRTDLFDWNRVCSFHLMDLPFCIACAKSHPLAAKERLTLDDLSGETVILLNRDDYNDELRTLLKEPERNIRVDEREYYDISTFNQVAASRDLILSARCWAEVHPLIATIPVDWKYAMPYGLVYSRDPAPELLEFIMAIGGTE